MSYKCKVEMDITDNRYVYNRSRKIYLEQKGEIHCSRCGYHRGENDERKSYGTLKFWRYSPSPNLTIWTPSPKKVRHPSWKLVSKNRKQWMEKPIIKVVKKSRWFGDYLNIDF